MDISDERNPNLHFDLPECYRRLSDRNRDPNNVTASSLQGPYLIDCSIDVPRIGLGHGLDCNRGIPTDFDRAYLDLLGFPPLHHNFTIMDGPKKCQPTESSSCLVITIISFRTFRFLGNLQFATSRSIAPNNFHVRAV